MAQSAGGCKGWMGENEKSFAGIISCLGQGGATGPEWEAKTVRIAKCHAWKRRQKLAKSLVAKKKSAKVAHRMGS